MSEEDSAERDQEVTEGGSVVYRHEERTIPVELTQGDGESIDRISQHIEQHLGEIDVVWHELVSDLVHIDIHVVCPTDERPWITLLTTGMSQAPMNTPPQAEGLRYAELLVNLPSDWPLTSEAFEDECNYWPLRLLKSLARLPHAYDTWLGHGHTIPNGDPAVPYASNTGFNGAILVRPVTVPEEFLTLDISEDKVINFDAVVPLYGEEMDLKLKKGTEALLERFDRQGIDDRIDLGRRNVGRRGWFRW